MVAFAFSESIVFRSVWWDSAVRDAMSDKKRSEFEKFSTIVSEKSFNGEIKLFFNKILKLWKNNRDIIFVFKRIQPSISREMINKKNIKTKTFNRDKRNGSPNISKNNL